MNKEIDTYGGSPYQIYKPPSLKTNMHTPSNPPIYKKGDRVQERQKKGDRDIRTNKRKSIEGPTKYLGGRKYTIASDPYLSKPNRANRRSWLYKVLKDGEDKAIEKGQNMIMPLEE
tara:strand:- start:1458 stop:1805 length:348 start_codon:yes stop_codon:yes gene_type:complete